MQYFYINLQLRTHLNFSGRSFRSVITAPLLVTTTPLLVTTTPLLVTTAPLLVTTAPLLVTTAPLLVITTPLLLLFRAKTRPNFKFGRMCRSL